MNEPKPDRSDVLVGRKLPEFALWEQLQRRAQPLGLEFCSSFFNNGMTYAQARKWLAEYGIKISVNALHGFYNSLAMRMRYTSLVAEQQALLIKQELPADMEEAIKERITQSMFELTHLNLSEANKLQLIALQQSKEGMQGNYELKKARLDLDREKFQVSACEYFLEWFKDKRAQDIANSSASNEQKIAQLRQTYFKSVDELQASGKVKLPE